MASFKWVLTFLKPYRVRYIIGLLMVVVTSSLSMINPYLTGTIVDDVINGGNYNILPTIIVVMVAGTFIKTVIRYLYLINFEYVSQEVTGNIRETIYRHIQKMDFNFYDHNRTGDLMARMTGDLESVRYFTAFIMFNMFDCFLTLSLAIIFLIHSNAVLTLVMLSIAPIMAICAVKFSKNGKPFFSAVREQYSKLNTVVQENISGNRVVKAFAREDYEIDKFLNENKSYADKNVAVSQIWAKYLPVMDSVGSMQAVALIVVGGLMVIYDPNFTIGQLVMFNSFLWAINNPIRMIGWMLGDLQWFVASSEKIITVLKSKSNVTNPKNVERVDTLNGSIKFKNVSFAYDSDGQNVLNNINIDIPAGYTVGIVGPTGAGKSTITNLMARFYDATKGEVLLDGKNVKGYDLNDIRRNISFAMQDIFLFSDTIEGNIAYGIPDVEFDEILNVAQSASARNFIEETPEKFDTIIGERGVGLSGGQKQRLALARALIKRPAILVLDDTTSAVDMETEADIQNVLRTQYANQTTIIIAHRISSVKHCDMIFVLEDGNITERGTHDELIKNNGYYSFVYNNQLGAV